MALDGAMLNIIKDELNNTARGSRVEKVTMPYKDRIILFLSERGFSKRLLISCSPSSPRIHYTNERPENPPSPPMICMLLRKKLAGGRLRGVRQAGLDRVLFLDFECKNELGDEVLITIVVEIMGRLSNIIITCDGKIIDSVRRFDPEEGKRFILPGAVYELPSAQDKVNILDGDTNEVIRRLKQSDKPLDKALIAALDGISPIICREIAFLALSGRKCSANSLSDDEYGRIEELLLRLKISVESPDRLVLIKDENGVPKDFTFMDIKQYGAEYAVEEYPDAGALLDAFFTARDSAELIHRQSAGLLKLLTNLSERVSRKIFARRNELKSTENREQLREYGELIKANLHMIKSGDSFLQAVNYYDPECKTIRIPLDVTLSPSKNAQKYFKEYRKAATAAGMLNELIREAEDELKYIDSVFDALTRAKSQTDLLQIRQELIETGYLKQKSGGRQKPIKSAPMKYVSSDGFNIYVGRNNHQNDILTLKTAAKNDMWLHTKNIPGSHVIIETDGREASETAIKQAAVLAARNSKAASGSQVPVDYALVRYVKKPSGAKPGMVIYTNNKTLYTDPDDEIFAKITEIK